MRTLEDRKIIEEYAKSVSFFKTILDEQGEDKFKELCSYLNYSYISGGEILFNIGTIIHNN